MAGILLLSMDKQLAMFPPSPWNKQDFTWELQPTPVPCSTCRTITLHCASFDCCCTQFVPSNFLTSRVYYAGPYANHICKCHVRCVFHLLLLQSMFPPTILIILWHQLKSTCFLQTGKYVLTKSTSLYNFQNWTKKSSQILCEKR